jgi:group I intron endonuclease
MEKIIGIYKITSPVGRIYIGQSRDVEHRFKRYLSMHESNSTQTRLHRSFKKYGVSSHTFEVIEHCNFSELNERERYWQDFYNVLSKNGMNCILQETDSLPKVYTKETLTKISGKNHWFYGKNHSDESKKKMSQAAKRRVVSDETRQKLSSIRQGSGNQFYGKTHSDDSKQKMSQSAKNRNIDEQTELLRRSKIGDAHRGKNLTAKHRERLSKAKQGSKNPMFGKTGKNHKGSKPVIQYTLNGEVVRYWDNAKDAARELGLSYGGIRQCCQLRIKKSGNFVWRFV